MLEILRSGQYKVKKKKIPSLSPLILTVGMFPISLSAQGLKTVQFCAEA